MSNFKILIVDDELQMRSLVKLFLTNSGFAVIEAKSGAECLEKLEKTKVDLIILDWMMPGIDGLEVCEQIRSGDVCPNVPIMFLTAKEQMEDRVQGLWSGADDYIVKPFAPEELVARVSALLRRSAFTTQMQNRDQNILQSGELQVNQLSRTVFIGGEQLILTPKEFDLLHFLATHPDRVFSREYLLEKIWNFDYQGDVRTVDTHIKRIRNKVLKLGGKADRIETIWGVGYKFNRAGIRS